MKTNLLKQARRLFLRPDIPTSTARHNCRAWARSVTQLGDRWLLAQKVQRKA